MTHASPPNCQAGTLSPETVPNLPALGLPESGGATEWVGASNCVPVFSSKVSTSLLYGLRRPIFR